MLHIPGKFLKVTESLLSFERGQKFVFFISTCFPTKFSSPSLQTLPMTKFPKVLEANKNYWEVKQLFQTSLDSWIHGAMLHVPREILKSDGIALFL